MWLQHFVASWLLDDAIESGILIEVWPREEGEEEGEEE
jgi:hypothetical protein